MRREIVKKTVLLFLSICLFAICLIWGCAQKEQTVHTEATQPPHEATVGTTEDATEDSTVTTATEIPPDTSESTAETNTTEATETTGAAETEATQPDEEIIPVETTESTAATEATETTEPVQTEATEPSEETTPTETIAPTEPTETETTTPEETEVPVEGYIIIYANLFGTAHSNPPTYTDETAAEIVLVAPAERAGYTFEGWFMGDTLVETLAGCSGDITLIARWKENSAIELPDIGF